VYRASGILSKQAPDERQSRGLAPVFLKWDVYYRSEVELEGSGKDNNNNEIIITTANQGWDVFRYVSALIFFA
jgi:hypothetical protein